MSTFWKFPSIPFPVLVLQYMTKAMNLYSHMIVKPLAKKRAQTRLPYRYLKQTREFLTKH